jgi:hypothetical protein
MENRIVVGPELLQEIEQERTEQTLQVRLSTYDIPREVSASEGQDGVLHIRFFYPDSEKETCAPGDNVVIHWRTGRHSGKLLGLDVRVREHGINRVDLLLQQIHRRASTLNKVNQVLNSGLIEGVLKRKGNELLTPA